MPDEAQRTVIGREEGAKVIEGMKEAIAHARGEISLLVAVRLPDGTRIEVDTQRDGEAGVWIATSRDIAGLVIQGATWSEMMTKLTLVIPSLIEGRADGK